MVRNEEGSPMATLRAMLSLRMRLTRALSSSVCSWKTTFCPVNIK